MEQNKSRSSFTSRIGFVLAAAGSAVGLGNIWRFPYLAAKYGGGIFLLVYLVLAVTFGFALMIAEIAIGRKTGLSAISAFQKLNKKWGFVGVLAAIVPVIIFPYYCVIGGWVTKYFVAFISGPSSAAAAAGDGYFGSFISQTGQPIVWLCVFIGITAIIVMLGVEKGIERASKILMPILVVLTVIVTLYSITRPGAWEGVVYYFKPDFSKFSVNTVLGALGQLFYSMSLAMGIMITYGSYMQKDNNLERAVNQIELFDTGIAFLAGLMIVPAVFAFSGQSPEKAGAGLMFEVLPKVFNSMTMGWIFGAAFFLLVFFAALTSAISLMETIVSIVQDKTGWSRQLVCIIVLLVSLLIALPSTLGYGPLSGIQPLGLSFLDFFDFISNSVLMPIVALLTCLFVGFIIKPKAISDEVKLSSKFHREKLFVVVTKYVAPLFIIAILISSVLNTLGVISI